jgi:hypothetical protein
MSKNPNIEKLSKSELRALHHLIDAELAQRRRKIEAELSLLTAIGSDRRGSRKPRCSPRPDRRTWRGGVRLA